MSNIANFLKVNEFKNYNVRYNKQEKRNIEDIIY
jgi:hypothetical protein